MRGYSRVDRREYEISPTSSTTIDRTVAKTGRRMQVSGSVTGSALGLGQRRVEGRLRGGRTRGRRVGEFHGDALAQLEPAGGDHDVVGAQSVQHFDTPLAP